MNDGACVNESVMVNEEWMSVSVNEEWMRIS